MKIRSGCNVSRRSLIKDCEKSGKTRSTVLNRITMAKTNQNIRINFNQMHLVQLSITIYKNWSSHASI